MASYIHACFEAVAESPCFGPVYVRRDWLRGYVDLTLFKTASHHIAAMSSSVNVKSTVSTVSMSYGKVKLVLEHDVPQAPQPEAPEVHVRVPNIRDTVKDKISNGAIIVHESRQPLTDRYFSMMICHAQEKQKFQVTGSFGMWNEAAEQALVTTLMRSKRASKQCNEYACSQRHQGHRGG